MSKINLIQASEFRPVFEHSWRPVMLQGEAIPPLLRNLPEDIGWGIIASGEIMATEPYSSRRIRQGRLVGGIDVYRHSPDDPVAFNKDWYAVVASDAHPETLFVEGPWKNGEHWLDEIPARYSGVKVILL